jgi:hypothetical protein
MPMSADYAPPEKRPPLRSYAVLMAMFNGLFVAGLVVARRRGRELPDRPPLGDIALVGVASHKLSRLITKDKVTSPIRAPFTELEGSGGPGELEEKARGSIGILFAPRPTRFVAALFAALTVSDFFQIAYKAAEEKGLG